MNLHTQLPELNPQQWQLLKRVIAEEVIGVDLPIVQPFDAHYDDIELASWRIFRKGANWAKAEQRTALDTLLGGGA